MFKKYRSKKLVEFRPITHGECRGFHQSTTTKGFSMRAVLISNNSEVLISKIDRKNGSPKIGDMIGRNPDNKIDQWLISEQDFNDMYELV